MPSTPAGRHDDSVAVLLKRLATDTGAACVRLLQRVEHNAGWTETLAIGAVPSRLTIGPETARRALSRRTPIPNSPSRSTLLRIEHDNGERLAALVLLQTEDPVTASRLAATFESWDLLASTLESQARIDTLTTALNDTDRQRRNAIAQTVIDQRLTECARAGGGLAALVHTCAQLTGKSVTLFDDHGRIITFSHAGRTSVKAAPLNDILCACHDISPDDDNVHIAVADRITGLSRRKMVVAVSAAGERFGFLVVDEHPSAFTVLDEHTAARAARLLGYEYSVQKRVARVAWNARSSLTRQLVRGTVESADLAASGEYLGVDICARRVVVYVLDRRITSADGADEHLATRVERQLDVEVLATRGAEGVMLLVEAPEHAGTLTMIARVKAAMIAVTDTSAESAIVGISSVCTAATLARGYREAREVVLCIDRFAQLPNHRVLAVDDLGPARLFLANSDVAAVRSYVDDVLGPLLAGTTGTADLLLTLQHYFDQGRSVRATAALLNLHENTIRLRLGRVHTITGLDVAADANDQLSVQTALLLLRLRGDAPSAALHENSIADDDFRATQHNTDSRRKLA
ncbi:CdaR family transcriptional regulator [Rhodococcus sp. YH3-3]|uniref:PucR family transcriptional regulator n=1 Tax=Rhodococcus sp. YH3-3 TaxID=1803579 RepID=UPI0007DB0BB1|nr:helix-turn-helix domain-containing protein [Rhodococcus sp. YH3-3]